MNIKQLSILSLACITSFISMHACEIPTTIQTTLQKETDRAIEEFNNIQTIVHQKPEWQKLFEERPLDNEDSVTAFYTSKEGKKYTYWDMRVDAFLKMKRYYEHKTTKDSLFSAVDSALFVDHYTRNTVKQEIRNQVNKELRDFINTIE